MDSGKQNRLYPGYTVDQLRGMRDFASKVGDMKAAREYDLAIHQRDRKSASYVPHSINDAIAYRNEMKLRQSDAN